MLLINEATLRALRAVHESALFDTCVRLVYSAGSGDYGYGAASYSEGDTIPCLLITGRFRSKLPDEVLDEVKRADAKLRVARGTTFGHRDRVKITYQHDDAEPSPITYEIIGGPSLTHMGIEFELKKVTDGSDA